MNIEFLEINLIELYIYIIQKLLYIIQAGN